MNKTIVACLAILCLIFISLTIYLYSLIPGFKVNMSSDYKLGFRIEPKKTITQNDCANAVNREYKERIVSLCKDKGVTLTLEEIGNEFDLKGCALDDSMSPRNDRELASKTEFCGYLFR